MRPASLQALRGLRRAPLRMQPPSSRICAKCRGQTPSNAPRCARASSNSSPSAKPYYITTPIFYVNADPHIGHLYTMVLTDVLKRWQQIQGKEAILCTGTDEHGMKIQRAAAKQNLPPKEFCDNNASRFAELAQLANISNDFFIRTTDKEHKDAVSEFWVALKNTPVEELGLYKGSHKGWYCVSDECFYPEDMVQPSVVPHSGRKIMVNTETENEVEWVKEETWFFPLKKYKDALLKFYDENPGWIQPAHRMAEVRDWVENHLEDLSVTRPASRLSWGIPDPEDDTQTIYVWVDALINYLTKAGYGSQWHAGSEQGKQGLWPADVQVIGKDIIRFHAIYWPALLMALRLPLPKQIVCHNHWTMSNRKMSKSVGNVVNPFYAIERWDVDPLRYFLMRNGSFTKDMGYSNELIMAVYTKELQANIGNLFWRVCRPKVKGKWSTNEAIEAYFKTDLENQVAKTGRQEYHSNLTPSLLKAPAAVKEHMDAFDPAGAVREIFDLLRETNRYISDTEPWTLNKVGSGESRLLLRWVIFHAAEALRIAGILLQPIMPSKAARLLDDLGVSSDRRTFDFASLGKDETYGTPIFEELSGTARTRQKWNALFPPPQDPDAENDVFSAQLGKSFRMQHLSRDKKMSELLAMEARLGEEQVARLLEPGKKASR